MQKPLRIAVLGGDARQNAAADYLQKQGCSVHRWGLSGAENCTDWRQTLPADAVLLPLPVTTDGLRIHTPSVPEQTLRFSALAGSLPSGTLVCGGKIPQNWISVAQSYGLTVFDYAEDGIFQLKNAVPTEEGAVLLALENLPVTLSGTCVAVTGYGRIASLLAGRLSGMGARVTVCARRASDLCHAQTRGLCTVRIRQGEPLLLPPDCRAVFNTVPSQLFDRRALDSYPPGCVFIELASLPGGIDLTAAGEREIRVVRGGGLPGRFFPESAGRIVGETLLDRFSELNGKE